MKPLNHKFTIYLAFASIFAGMSPSLANLNGEEITFGSISSPSTRKAPKDLKVKISGPHTIKNRGMNIGLLCWTYDQSPEQNFKVQSLEGGCYLNEREKYMPGGEYRGHVIWDITPVENGAYTIRNHALGSFLTYSSEMGTSGPFAQLVQANTSHGSDFGVEGLYRDRVLWDIILSDDGAYKLRNRALNASLSWTYRQSQSGFFAQLLHGGTAYNPLDYEKNGRFVNQDSWELFEEDL